MIRETDGELAYKLTIVCLANSRKLKGRCVAGLQLRGANLGPWIRPVIPSGKGELFAERLYAGWKDPQLLDLIEIAFLQPRPIACHQEDHLINSAEKWVRKGSVDREFLNPGLEEVRGHLWFDGGSTSNGLNDRIPAEVAEQLRSSLKLIQPKSITMRVQTEGAYFGKPKKKVRGLFSIAGHSYIFSVTDPVIEAEFKNAPEGAERIVVDPILCISLSEVFEEQNACFKLIAGVLE